MIKKRNQSLYQNNFIKVNIHLLKPSGYIFKMLFKKNKLVLADGKI